MSVAHRTLRTPDDLAHAGLLADARALDAVAARYDIAITPHVLGLIANADDPIGRQYVPHPDEALTAPDELADPTQEGPYSPVKGIVHRHADRALLLPLLACPVYCRFCFRRESVGADGGVLTPAELDAALDYIRATPAITEVILTGGDPLMLSARRLRGLLAALEAIAHIALLRIHTRVPVADPARVTPALVDALRTDKPLFLAVHANHAAEFVPAAHAALLALSRAGIPLLGQSVLLAGVNDSADALEDLFRAMLSARIKPYYLHHLDPAPGTARFRVPVARGQALLAALRPRVTGLAWPTYVIDRPEAGGKLPLVAAATPPV